MAYIFLGLFVGTIILGKKVYRTYVNPCTIFIGVFEFAFFMLFASDFINIKLITDKLWIIYLVSFFAFVMGIVLNRRYRFSINGKLYVDKGEKKEKKIYKKEIWIIFSLALVTTLIYWMQVVRMHGFSGIIRSLMTSYEVANLGGMPVIILYVKMLTIFLSPYVLNYIIVYKEKKMIYYVMIAFTFIANIAYTRDALFYLAALDGFVYAYTHIKNDSKISFKWAGYLILGVIALKFFSYTQSLLNKQFEVSGHFLGIQMSGAMITIVSYFVGPLVSAGIYLNTLNNVPFLGYILRNFFAIMNMLGITNIDTDIYMPQEMVYIPFQFNTTPIQLYIFKEGGWIWLVLFFMAIGFIVDRTFVNYVKSHSRYTLMALIFWSLVLVMSIRSNMLTRLDMFVYILTLIVLLVSRKIVIGKKRIRK